jgi:hypothetical protein
MTFKASLCRMQWLFVLALFLAVGCSDGARTPTEPIPLEPSKAAVTAPAGQEAPAIEGLADDLRPAARTRLAGAQGTGPAETGRAALPLEKPVIAPARGGNGNGNGNGKPDGNGNGNGNGNGKPDGNGNGNGNGGGGRGGELKLDVQPGTWNTNWAHTEGTVQAFVRGKDATKIDTGSVELVAEGGSLAPTRVRIAGGQFVAHFFKSDAFELLGEADTGETHDVTLRFTVGEETKELTVKIRTVGPSTGGGDDDDDDGDDEEDDRTLEIKPSGWNMNWRNSAGQVHAFIRGEGLADIDLDSIVLVGDREGAEAVEPLDVRRVGKQIVARFAKRDAFASLDEPEPGKTHTVKIRFSEEGAEGSEDAETELSDTVRILGSS